MSNNFDFLIIGAGVVALGVARALRAHYPSHSIIVLEKEADIALHASGRNSGVLHAGFYYTANSLKAKFCVEGNQAMKQFCAEKGLAINRCGKLVVATSDAEVDQIFELERRGRANGVTLEVIDEDAAHKIEPHVCVHRKALFSPNTATVSPQEVCRALHQELQEQGVTFACGTKYLERTPFGVLTTKGEFRAKTILNCAGLYADKIAHDFGFGAAYTMLPFKGLYLKYSGAKDLISTNIYPVPDLRFPFLGVHFTKTVEGYVKIGPTAIPAFWRENYGGLSAFNPFELSEILLREAQLFLSNKFNFRMLAIEEMKKYNHRYLVGLAKRLLHGFDAEKFDTYTPPGIRAQLLDKRTQLLVQDFVVEGDNRSVHVLNAVSPGFTCALPFGKHVVEKYVVPHVQPSAQVGAA